MPEDDTDLDLDQADESEVTEPSDPATLTVDEWKRREAKLRDEAHKLRATLRRTEMSKEYGDEVLEFVPSVLPLKEQKELAAKLAAKLGAQVKAQDAQATPETPSTGFQEPNVVEVPAPQAGPTPEERNIAAVAQGSSPSAASTAQTPLPIEQAEALAMSDPAAYQRLKAAGLIRPEKLEDAFG